MEKSRREQPVVLVIAKNALLVEDILLEKEPVAEPAEREYAVRHYQYYGECLNRFIHSITLVFPSSVICLAPVPSSIFSLASKRFFVASRTGGH